MDVHIQIITQDTLTPKMSDLPEQTRAIPANLHISDLESRLHSTNKLLIDNIKDLQIVRSQLTGLSHSQKEILSNLNADTSVCYSELQNNFKTESDNQQCIFDEFKKLLKSLSNERFMMMQEILLLDKRVEEFEDEFGGPRM